MDNILSTHRSSFGACYWDALTVAHCATWSYTGTRFTDDRFNTVPLFPQGVALLCACPDCNCWFSLPAHPVAYPSFTPGCRGLISMVGRALSAVCLMRTPCCPSKGVGSATLSTHINCGPECSPLALSLTPSVLWPLLHPSPANGYQQAQMNLDPPRAMS